MEAPKSLQQPPTPQPEKQPTPPETFTSQPPKKPAESVDAQQLESSPPVIIDTITIPSCSRWFTLDNIHEPERRFLPEFFNGKSASKNEKVYMYYRNSMIKMFRKNPSKKITFTQVRKVLVGDVGSIRRVFDFLESWGLINYTGISSKQHSKLEDKENKLSSDLKGNSSLRKDTSTRFCSGCKSLCSIACFVCDQLDLTLCARCYVRGNHQASADDFRRVEISDQSKTEWTDKETLKLLEAIMHFGEDWKKVAEHVGGRSEKECVARFVKLPFKEQFLGPPESEEVDKYYETSTPDDAETCEKNLTKKRRLTPFADTSNPIMAQVAFLSAMVGSEVAEAAARAAVEALSGSNLTSDQRGVERSYVSVHYERDHNEFGSTENGGDTVNTLVEAVAEARAQVQKEEQNLEKSITEIVEVQMKEFQEKITHFEEVELQMEKEWKQLQYMKNLLFTDQLTLLSQKDTPSAAEKTTSGINFSEPVGDSNITFS